MFSGFRGVSAYELNKETEIDASLFTSQLNADAWKTTGSSDFGATEGIKITYFYDKDPRTFILKTNDQSEPVSAKMDGKKLTIKHRNSCELIKERSATKTGSSDPDNDVADEGDNRRTSFCLPPVTIPDRVTSEKDPLAMKKTPTPILRKSLDANKIDNIKVDSNTRPVPPPRKHRHPNKSPTK